MVIGYAHARMNPIYRTEPYRQSAETKLLQVQRKADGNWLLLFTDMLFYPGGGGQPGDQGAIYLGEKRFEVHGFEKQKGDVWIVTQDEETDLTPYQKSLARMELDWAFRYRAMQMHTLQHALGAATRMVFAGYETRGMTILPDLSRCDMRFVTAEKPRDPALAETLQRTESAIAADLPVEAVYFNSAAEAREHFGEVLRMDPRLPEYKGRARVVVINPEGAGSSLQDASPCGGTHLRNLSEIPAVELLDCQPAEEPGEWVLSFTLSRGSR